MASLETLLSSVKSETPISFFLVTSNVAFFGLAELPPDACWAFLAALSLGRREIPCEAARRPSQYAVGCVYAINPSPIRPRRGDHDSGSDRARHSP